MLAKQALFLEYPQAESRSKKQELPIEQAFVVNGE
jgi:hypothetical protein